MTTIQEAYRIWTTIPRREWAKELDRFPVRPGRGVCDRDEVYKALRLAFCAQQMGGEYMRMSTENRFRAGKSEVMA